MIRAFQRKGVAGAKTLLFPNGIDLSASRPAPPPGNFRRRMGLAANDVLAVYSGNLGAKHGVEILLEAARRLQDAPITIVICGEGASRPLLERRASELGLKNALLLPLQPAAEYLEMMVDTDIYFVTQQPGSRSLFFPSKLLPGLALAKAVVVVADPESELTSAAREGEFAVVVNPSQPEELAKVVRQLAAAPGQRKSLGAVGRRYVEQFEQGRLLRVFAEQLCEVVSGPCQPVPGPTKPAVSPHESVT
jgi:colanic acid biosynthesis glycosyl transferase WcaI